MHIVCSGFLYGNGEQNDIFYEFFRSAWVSLHPQLAALPVIGGGGNHLPTIHVRDLANALEAVLCREKEFLQILFAVDGSVGQTLKEFMTVISEGIGSGAVKDLQIGDAIKE